MEGVAQLAEHRVVASVAAGSSPAALPTTDPVNLVIEAVKEYLPICARSSAG
jgi:hypothetical protein